MAFAWLLTLPGAGLVGGLAALLSIRASLASSGYWCCLPLPAS